MCSPPREAQVSGSTAWTCACAVSAPVPETAGRERSGTLSGRGPFLRSEQERTGRRRRLASPLSSKSAILERPKATGASPSLPISHGGKNELAARFQNPKDFAERERDDVRCQFARNPDHGLDRRGRSLEVEQGTIICGTELTICAAALDGLSTQLYGGHRRAAAEFAHGLRRPPGLRSLLRAATHGFLASAPSHSHIPTRGVRGFLQKRGSSATMKTITPRRTAIA